MQRILVKDLRLGAVGLDIIDSSWERIKKNYRNSKQILKAAGRLANLYGEQAKAQGVEIDVLDPELAERETSKPLAIAVKEEGGRGDYAVLELQRKFGVQRVSG